MAKVVTTVDASHPTWRLYLPSLKDGRLIVTITTPSGGAKIIKELIEAGLVATYRPTAELERAFFISKPSDKSLSVNLKDLCWYTQLVLTAAGKSALNRQDNIENCDWTDQMNL